MKKRMVVEINDQDCDGCGQCLTVCDTWALKVINGKVHLLDEKYCTGRGICVSICQNGALSIVERRADIFDKKVVDNHLQSLFLYPLYVEN